MKTRKNKNITRRNVLPLLGSALLFPVLGFGKPSKEKVNISNLDNDEYQTLLKPDGTTVKVKVTTLKKSKIVKKNISNKSFFNWLGKKI